MTVWWAVGWAVWNRGKLLMVGMSRARIEEKKEQRKESEDLMTEVEVWRKARERRKIHGEV